ncbi:eukaryotic translation initiation factor 5 [Dorcoceras hygrometricum]|uniref:Eukaryotic translation initiation factor 5 n=1 Tax=Dorcoceras hygrometricum TaxID=472368 RepID=A0A2Z7AWE3_9LAMI|nr:eukaryotic translation initiation factor 5 [Dorcoceras hygrometricum]
MIKGQEELKNLRKKLLRRRVQLVVLRTQAQKHPARRNPITQMRTIRHLVARKMRMKTAIAAGESDDDVEWQTDTSAAAA